MSASSKKKLRREQEAAKLTERQLTEQKEAKKLNLYTTLFVSVLALLLVIALTVGIVNTINNSGVRERNTVALTVGSHEINSVEMNYFMIDSVNTFLNNYGAYATMFGLDTTKPLNQQVMDTETGTTWADDFLNSAVESARSVYALVDAANADGFSLTEEQQAEIDYMASTLSLYAGMYGYSSADDYMEAMYGNGADLESYKNYYTNNILADAYYADYAANLTYEDADILAEYNANPTAYTSYSYNYHYVAANKFLEGGTENEDGVLTYSDEEKAASVAAAEAAAKELTLDTLETVEQFDAAIALMPIYQDIETEMASIACDDYMYSSIMGVMSDWITDESREAGDKTYIPSTTTSTDADGNEVTTTNGYYVVFYRETNDNNFPLVNVRHILVSFKGGSYDETAGTNVYSDEEKAEAWTAAEELLDSWKSGEATEESFAALATEKSTDTGSAANGGLYENIYPGQMVDAFEDWCFENHRTGDTGLVETNYGVHVMYYAGESDTSYRDYLVTNTLISNDITEWHDALSEAMTVTEGDTTYVAMDLVLSAQ